MRLENRNVIVTGAAQGIGAAIARSVVEYGGRVIAIDLNADGLKALSAELGPDRCQFHVGSVADPDFVNATVDAIVEKNGAIHGLVNNAGIVRAAMITNMERDKWQQVIDVNLSGVFYCLQAVGRHMLAGLASKKSNAASIVNISSDAGRRGTIGQINYGAAKSGVLGLTMSAAREWSGKGVRVNSICFGVVETPMTETVRGPKFRDGMLAQVPMGRFAKPEEVSEPIVFLLSDSASYITGQHLSVNGGYTIGV